MPGLKLPEFIVVAVLAIVVGLKNVKLSSVSHLTILPVCVPKLIFVVPVSHIGELAALAAPGTVVVSTFTVYVAVAAVHGALLTVIVKVTVFPASPIADVYVGVNVLAPDVILPAPFSVHNIVPLLELAPLTVAVPNTHIV